MPKWEELNDVSNVHDCEKQTPGRSRYRTNYWPEGQARTIIWLLNPVNLPSYANDSGMDDRYEFFIARFNVMRWNKRDNCFYIF